MSRPESEDLEERVLLLVPTSRDADLCRRIFAEAGLACFACRSLAEVCAEMARGGGAALLSQEAILADRTGCLPEALARQPQWSDFPLVVLTPPGANPAQAGRALEAIGHMTLLKRPVPIAELVSTVRAALRDRRRQYQTRALIEERERQARALREGGEDLSFALEAGRLGSWQVDLATGEATGSPRHRANLGLPPGPAEPGGGPLGPIHPEDRDLVNRAMAESIRGRTAIDVEYRVVRPDGGSQWVLARGRGAYDERGRPTRMAGVSLDITARKRDEEALRESERTFRFLADSMPQVVFTARADGSLDYANRVFAEYVGRDDGSALGTGWADFLHPDDVRPAQDRWARSVATGEDYEVEFRIRRADGVHRWFLSRALPMKGPDGRVLRWFGTCTDVEEIKQANKALQDADLRKDEFLAMLAHELRNPLAAVNNAVTVLKMSDAPENREWASDVVERQVKQLSRLIDDLLDVSRIRSGKIRLRRERVDAGPILRQAVESARPLIEERDHRLSVAIDAGELPVNADPTRLEQIAVNLLTNAAKYTEAGGRIWLTAGVEGDQVAIRVRDDGIGIPPEKLPEMFQLFAQGERSIARSEGGLGIGLTIVQRLAEMHGGSVSASSEGPGKGSEFTVVLPAATTTGPAPAGRAAAKQGPGRGYRILVVDDNEDTARGMARLLKLLGNEIRVAHDGPSAVAVGGEFLPEFVLLDIGLPGMDGYQVAATFRDDPRFRDTVIIAISGYGQEDDRRRSRAAGFHHHLVKPVDHDALMTLLAQPLIRGRPFDRPGRSARIRAGAGTGPTREAAASALRRPGTGSPPMLRVFVSSTSRDLQHHREAVKGVILDHGWHPVMMEHFGALHGTTLDACLGQVAGSDLLLLIVAYRRGWVPTPAQGGDGRRSVTAFELDEARRRGIPVLGLLAGPNWPGVLWEDDQEARGWVNEFRAGINQVVAFFGVEATDPETDEPRPGGEFRARVRKLLQDHRDWLVSQAAVGSPGPPPGRPAVGAEAVLPRLAPLIGGLIVPGVELTAIYRRSVPAGWEPPPDGVNPIARLGRSVESLARAPRQSEDGEFPLLRFVRALAGVIGGDQAAALVAWANDATARLGLDPAGPDRTGSGPGRAAEGPAPGASPCHLLVQVEPRVFESGRYAVKAWLFGTGEPACLLAGEEGIGRDEVAACLDGLREEFLRRVDEPEHAWVELLLPRELLCAAVNQWPVGLDDFFPSPLGVEHRLVVRSLDRASRPKAALALKARARALHARPVGGCRLVDSPTAGTGEALWIEADDCGGLALYAALKDAQGLVGAAMGRPPRPTPRDPECDVLNTLFKAGFPVVLWLRRDPAGDPASTRAEIAAILGDEPLGRLPDRVWELRKQAACLNDPAHIGHHLSLLWDDPARSSPDFEARHRLRAPSKEG